MVKEVLFIMFMRTYIYIYIYSRYARHVNYTGKRIKLETLIFTMHSERAIRKKKLSDFYDLI